MLNTWSAPLEWGTEWPQNFNEFFSANGLNEHAA